MPDLPETQKLDRANSDQSRIRKASGLLLTESASTHWLNIGKSFASKTWLDKTAIGGALRMQSPFGSFQPIWSEIGKNLLPGIALFNEMAAMKRPQYWVGSIVAKDFASMARLWGDNSVVQDSQIGSALRLIGTSNPWFKKNAPAPKRTIEDVFTYWGLKFPSAGFTPEAWVDEGDQASQAELFEAIAEVKVETLQALIDTVSQHNTTPTVEEARGQYGQDVTKSAQDELVAAIRAEPGQARPSPQALSLLIATLVFLMSVYEAIAQWHDFRESLCDLNSRVLVAPSLADARKAVSAFSCGIPKAVAAQLRMVTRDNVQLREAPRMKSAVIMKLPLYASLEILDSEDRTWIHVLYKHDGQEVVGWISRSMVRTVPGR